MELLISFLEVVVDWKSSDIKQDLAGVHFTGSTQVLRICGDDWRKYSKL